MGMSAAGYHLAKQGVKTRLVHAFDLPHTQGSHHGETRLIRHAYSGDPAYIDIIAGVCAVEGSFQTEYRAIFLVPH